MATAFHKMDQSLRADRGLVSGLLLLAGLGLIGAWLMWAFSAHVTRYEVSDSARLEVAGAASPVEANQTGEVALSHLVLGQQVQAGAVLLQLDDREQQLALKQELAKRNELGPQLEALRMQLQSEDAGRADEERVLVYSKSGAQAQVQQAKAEAAIAAQEADRAQKLRLAGLISEADAQKSRAAAESKRAAVENLQQAELRLTPELDVRSTDRTVKQRAILTDIAKLEGDIATSDAEIARLRYEIEKRKLRATVSGKLTECQVLHPGAHINEGQQLGVILPAGKVQMIADFNPASAFGKLHAGQQATIRLNGFPWAQFGVVHATVSRVAGEIHDGKVHVELALNPDSGSRIPLQHGLPGTVEVSVEQVTPVAMLAALRRTGIRCALRKLFIPEVVQTSSLDCGPAALKAMLEGFGRHVNYGSLRDACQTGLDGTSIDTLEAVANQFGLEAEQIMLPLDHLLLPAARALPAIVVVMLAQGITHFVVVWNRIGKWLQIMDPAVGRRWVHSDAFLKDVYQHAMPVGSQDWLDFASSEDFQRVFRARQRRLGIRLASGGNAAALDAAVRLTQSLADCQGIARGRSAQKIAERFAAEPALIPKSYWTVEEAGTEEVLMRGAVLLRAKGRRSAETSSSLPETKQAPAQNLLIGLFKGSGMIWPVLLTALLAAAGGAFLEALLFRGLLDVNQTLALAGQRMSAAVAVLIFCLSLLLLELPAFVTGARLGRILENRLRIAFLEKLPTLSDRYFQSRPVSDMAERSHILHRLRHLPDQVRQLVLATAQLAITAAGVVWLDPGAWPFMLASLGGALIPLFSSHWLLAERDLRVRTHSGRLNALLSGRHARPDARPHTWCRRESPPPAWQLIKRMGRRKYPFAALSSADRSIATGRNVRAGSGPPVGASVRRRACGGGCSSWPTGR